MKPLRTAVIGVGYLGRFHAQKHTELAGIELNAVVDIDERRARDVGDELGVRHFTDYHEVLNDIDAAAIVVPAELHYPITRDCLQAGLHVLVEKPMTETVAQADALVQLAEQHKRVLQVGHLERFNPVVEAMRQHASAPLFIEAHRLSPMSNRGTAVDVVLDLMIHDLDIVLELVDDDIVNVRAMGLRVLTDEIDIANARLEFAGGCTANITASRVSRSPLRKMRIFQPDTYLSVDFLTRHVAVSHKDSDQKDEHGYPVIRSQEQQLGKVDALLEETAAFVEAIRNGSRPLVCGRDGRRALDAAQRITACMREPR
jgi:predicted dehydrogenase